ncbi:unnamed protein product, partial [Bubo scandiacus]
HPKPFRGSREGWEQQDHPYPRPLQVPKIMRYIHKNVEHIRTEPAQHSLDSLLLLLTRWSPNEVVRSLLRISPTCDRNEGGSNPGITPSPQLKDRPRGGGCQVSFPGLWCHLPASASPQASRDTLSAFSPSTVLTLPSGPQPPSSVSSPLLVLPGHPSVPEFPPSSPQLPPNYLLVTPNPSQYCQLPPSYLPVPHAHTASLPVTSQSPQDPPSSPQLPPSTLQSPSQHPSQFLPVLLVAPGVPPSTGTGAATTRLGGGAGGGSVPAGVPRGPARPGAEAAPAGPRCWGAPGHSGGAGPAAAAPLPGSQLRPRCCPGGAGEQRLLGAVRGVSPPCLCGAFPLRRSRSDRHQPCGR